MSGEPATMVSGAGDLQCLVSQLNLWTPQIELTLQELREAQLVMSGHMQRLCRECGNRAHESHCVVPEQARHQCDGENTV